MKKIFIIVLSITFFSELNAQEKLKFFIDKFIKNNLQLNAERKNLSLLSKIRIFQEVNFTKYFNFKR